MTEWEKVSDTHCFLQCGLSHFIGTVWLLSVLALCRTTCSRSGLAFGIDGRILTTMYSSPLCFIKSPTFIPRLRSLGVHP